MLPPQSFTIISLLFSLLPQLPALPVLPNPDPATIQQQQFHPNSSPPATIPSFPEQSALSACPIRLPDELFPAIKSSCGGGKLYRGKCCPVLATWLYSAYSDIALGRTNTNNNKLTETTSSSSSYDMPMLPDDSETCVNRLEKAIKDKGVDLVRPNGTCDVVYCFCGIRLHPLTCPQAFPVSEDGSFTFVEGESVKKLERDCLSRNQTTSASLATCSKCLNSLYRLKKGQSTVGNTTKLDGRTSKMRSRDCELMGLTWLLNKDRNAYMSTVSQVMRALMMDVEGSDPQSCSLSSDGMPLAVDSVEIDGQSSSVALRFPLLVYLLGILLACF